MLIENCRTFLRTFARSATICAIIWRLAQIHPVFTTDIGPLPRYMEIVLIMQRSLTVFRTYCSILRSTISSFETQIEDVASAKLSRRRVNGIIWELEDVIREPKKNVEDEERRCSDLIQHAGSPANSTPFIMRPLRKSRELKHSIRYLQSALAGSSESNCQIFPLVHAESEFNPSIDNSLLHTRNRQISTLRCRQI